MVSSFLWDESIADNTNLEAGEKVLVLVDKRIQGAENTFAKLTTGSLAWWKDSKA